MGKDHHTSSRRPVWAKSHAAGSRTTNWRQMDTTMLYMGLPMAWHTEPAIMQKPASRKEMLMMRRAGTPMAVISAEASNRDSSVAGASWNTAKPIVMMHTAVQMVSFTVRFTRSSRAAP